MRCNSHFVPDAPGTGNDRNGSQRALAHQVKLGQSIFPGVGHTDYPIWSHIMTM